MTLLQQSTLSDSSLEDAGLGSSLKMVNCETILMHHGDGVYLTTSHVCLLHPDHISNFAGKGKACHWVGKMAMATFNAEFIPKEDVIAFKRVL